MIKPEVTMTKQHDESAHKALLQKGTYTLSPKDDVIHIDKVNSHKQGSGFGTAVVREVIKEALENNKKVTLEAEKKSHIFHLYMGMVPTDRQVLYVNAQYGLDTERTIDSLNDYDNAKDLNESEHLSKLLTILGTELDLSPHTLNAQDVIDNKAFLLDLIKRSVSFITFQFIPQFLRILRADIATKYPDTSNLHIVPMELSAQGRARWQDAITQGIEFTPFKEFESLLPYMTDEQKKQLNSIFELRLCAPKIMAEIEAVKDIEVNYSSDETVDDVTAHKAKLLEQLKAYDPSTDLIKRAIMLKTREIEFKATKQLKAIDIAAAQNPAKEPGRQQLEGHRVNGDKPHTAEVNNTPSAVGGGDTVVNASNDNPVVVNQVPNDVKTKLTDIVSTLINNINIGAGGRLTSSTAHKKVFDLKSIHAKLSGDEQSVKTTDEHIRDIMDVCKVKRNSLHFWATPHSVDEFNTLLKVNGITLSSENKSILN